MTTIETITLTTAIIGAVCGCLGAVLGIINTWHKISCNTVKLKVIPKLAFMLGGAGTVTVDKNIDKIPHPIAERPSRLCIEIINLSSFPVTISDVGFGNVTKVRHTLCNAELSPGKKWPCRLESREAVVVYAGFGVHLDAEVVTYPKAYASTDCGAVHYGTSPAFKDYLFELQKQADQKHSA